MNKIKSVITLALFALGITAAQAENVAKIGDTYYATLDAAVVAAKAGETVEIIKTKTYTLPASIPNNIAITGAVVGVDIDATGKGSISSIPNGATFKNVSFVFGNEYYHGFYHAGLITMENCDLDGLLFSYGQMTFRNCRFLQETEEYCMWVYGGSPITYDGCSFKVQGKCLNVYREGEDGVRLNVTNCTFNSTVLDKSAINFKESCVEKGIVLCTEGILSDCKTTGLFPTDKVGGSPLYMIDDIVSTNHTKGGVMIECDGERKWPLVAEIVGGEKYPTLEAAAKATKDGDTVRLLQPCAADGVICTNSVAFDLNGWDLTVYSTFTSVADLTLTNSLPTLGGFDVNGSVTVNGGTLDASALAIGTGGVLPGKAGGVFVQKDATFVMMNDWASLSPNWLAANRPGFLTAQTGGKVKMGSTVYTMDDEGTFNTQNAAAKATITVGTLTYVDSFNDLQQALDAADAGTTVRMLKDASGKIVISNEGVVTLDLNGHAINNTEGQVIHNHGGTLSWNLTGGKASALNGYENLYNYNHGTLQMTIDNALAATTNIVIATGDLSDISAKGTYTFTITNVVSGASGAVKIDDAGVLMGAYSYTLARVPGDATTQLVLKVAPPDRTKVIVNSDWEGLFKVGEAIPSLPGYYFGINAFACASDPAKFTETKTLEIKGFALIDKKVTLKSPAELVLTDGAELSVIGDGAALEGLGWTYAIRGTGTIYLNKDASNYDLRCYWTRLTPGSNVIVKRASVTDGMKTQEGQFNLIASKDQPASTEDPTTVITANLTENSITGKGLILRADGEKPLVAAGSITAAAPEKTLRLAKTSAADMTVDGKVSGFETVQVRNRNAEGTMAITKTAVAKDVQVFNKGLLTAKMLAGQSVTVTNKANGVIADTILQAYGFDTANDKYATVTLVGEAGGVYSNVFVTAGYNASPDYIAGNNGKGTIEIEGTNTFSGTVAFGARIGSDQADKPTADLIRLADVNATFASSVHQPVEISGESSVSSNDAGVVSITGPITLTDGTVLGGTSHIRAENKTFKLEGTVTLKRGTTIVREANETDKVGEFVVPARATLKLNGATIACDRMTVKGTLDVESSYNTIEIKEPADIAPFVNKGTINLAGGTLLFPSLTNDGTLNWDLVRGTKKLDWRGVTNRGTLQATVGNVTNDTSYALASYATGAEGIFTVTNSVAGGKAVTVKIGGDEVVAEDGLTGYQIKIADDNLVLAVRKYTCAREVVSGTKTLEAGKTYTAAPTDQYGGAFFVNAGATLIGTDVTFKDNSAGNGGAIYSYGTVTLANATFEGNQADLKANKDMDGGAIFNFNGTVNIDGTVTLKTETDTIRNFRGTLNWNRTDGKAGLLNGYENIRNSDGKLQITVDSTTTSGVIATGDFTTLEGKDTFTLKNAISGATAEIKINSGYAVLDGSVYTLALVPGDVTQLVLTVVKPDRTKVVVNSNWEVEYKYGEAIEDLPGFYFGMNAFADVPPAALTETKTLEIKGVALIDSKVTLKSPAELVLTDGAKLSVIGDGAALEGLGWTYAIRGTGTIYLNKDASNYDLRCYWTRLTPGSNVIVKRASVTDGMKTREGSFNVIETKDKPVSTEDPTTVIAEDFTEGSAKGLILRANGDKPFVAAGSITATNDNQTLYLAKTSAADVTVDGKIVNFKTIDIRNRNAEGTMAITRSAVATKSVKVTNEGNLTAKMLAGRGVTVTNRTNGVIADTILQAYVRNPAEDATRTVTLYGEGGVYENVAIMAGYNATPDYVLGNDLSGKIVLEGVNTLCGTNVMGAGTTTIKADATVNLNGVVFYTTNLVNRGTLNWNLPYGPSTLEDAKLVNKDTGTLRVTVGEFTGKTSCLLATNLVESVAGETFSITNSVAGGKEIELKVGDEFFTATKGEKFAYRLSTVTGKDVLFEAIQPVCRLVSKDLASTNYFATISAAANELTAKGEAKSELWKDATLTILTDSAFTDAAHFSYSTRVTIDLNGATVTNNHCTIAAGSSYVTVTNSVAGKGGIVNNDSLLVHSGATFDMSALTWGAGGFIPGTKDSASIGIWNGSTVKMGSTDGKTPNWMEANKPGFFLDSESGAILYIGEAKYTLQASRIWTTEDAVVAATVKGQHSPECGGGELTYNALYTRLYEAVQNVVSNGTVTALKPLTNEAYVTLSDFTFVTDGKEVTLKGTLNWNLTDGHTGLLTGYQNVTNDNGTLKLTVKPSYDATTSYTIATGDFTGIAAKGTDTFTITDTRYNAEKPITIGGEPVVIAGHVYTLTTVEDAAAATTNLVLTATLPDMTKVVVNSDWELEYQYGEEIADLPGYYYGINAFACVPAPAALTNTTTLEIAGGSATIDSLVTLKYPASLVLTDGAKLSVIGDGAALEGLGWTYAIRGTGTIYLNKDASNYDLRCYWTRLTPGSNVIVKRASVTDGMKTREGSFNVIETKDKPVSTEDLKTVIAEDFTEGSAKGLILRANGDKPFVAAGPITATNANQTLYLSKTSAADVTVDGKIAGFRTIDIRNLNAAGTMAITRPTVATRVVKVVNEGSLAAKMLAGQGVIVTNRATGVIADTILQACVRNPAEDYIPTVTLYGEGGVYEDVAIMAGYNATPDYVLGNDGLGTVELEGANTFSGETVIHAAKVKIPAGSALTIKDGTLACTNVINRGTLNWDLTAGQATLDEAKLQNRGRLFVTVGNVKGGECYTLAKNLAEPITDTITVTNSVAGGKAVKAKAGDLIQVAGQFWRLASGNRTLTLTAIPSVQLSNITVKGAKAVVYADNWAIKVGADGTCAVPQGVELKLVYTARDEGMIGPGWSQKTLELGSFTEDTALPDEVKPVVVPRWTTSRTIAIDTRERIVITNANDILPIAYSVNNWGEVEGAVKVLLAEKAVDDPAKMVVLTNEDGYANCQIETGAFGPYVYNQTWMNAALETMGMTNATVAYAEKAYALTLTNTLHGTVAATVAGKAIASGDAVLGYDWVKLTATPEAHYMLKEWTSTDGSFTNATTAVTRFEMPTQEATIEAAFGWCTTFDETVTVAAGEEWSVFEDDNYKGGLNNSGTVVWKPDTTNTYGYASRLDDFRQFQNFQGGVMRIVFDDTITSGRHKIAGEAYMATGLTFEITNGTETNTCKVVTESEIETTEWVDVGVKSFKLYVKDAPADGFVANDLVLLVKGGKLEITYKSLAGFLEGGIDTTNIVTVIDGGYKFPTTPSRDGYEFAGWYLGWEPGAERVTEGTAITIPTNHALYAQWTSTDPTGEHGRLVMSDYVGTEPVQTISGYAHRGDISIYGLVTPTYLSVVQDGAFARCQNLRWVFFTQPRDPQNPDDKTSLYIGKMAFAGTAIETLIIPEGAIIDAAAFYGCPSLKRIVFQGNGKIKCDVSAFSLSGPKELDVYMTHEFAENNKELGEAFAKSHIYDGKKVNHHWLDESPILEIGSVSITDVPTFGADSTLRLSVPVVTVIPGAMPGANIEVLYSTDLKTWTVLDRMTVIKTEKDSVEVEVVIPEGPNGFFKVRSAGF